MTRTVQHTLLFFIILSLSVLLPSCDKFEGDQTVPSYIQVDSIGLTTDYSIEGTAAHDIKDVWLYVNDQLIGGFELSSRIPVLAEGINTIEIRPGIKLNGISATRAPYPYFDPIIREEVKFIPDSVIRMSTVTRYRDNTKFVWMEDFEDASLAIDVHSNSDTGIYRTTPANVPGAFLDEQSEYSGIVYLDDERPYVLLQSDDGNGQGFILDQGDFIFLEVHFKTEVPIIVGLIIYQQEGYLEKRPMIGLNATDNWKKVYVNFTPIVNDSPGAIDFKVYFEAQKPVGHANTQIWLDNIKLLSRQNL